jgi:hypothetical protein
VGSRVLFVVLGFSLFEGALVDFDLLVEEVCLCAASDELRAEDVPFGDDEFVLLLELLLLVLDLLDDGLELVLLDEEVADLVLLVGDVLLELLDLLLLSLDLLVLVAVLSVLLHQLVLLRVDLLLQLRDLVRHSLVPVRVLVLLLLHLRQLLRHQVAVRPHRLVQRLLLLQLRLSFDVLLLELGNEVVAQLHLVARVEVLGLRGCGLEGVGVALLLQSDDALVQFLNFLLLAEQLVLLLLQLLLPVQDLLQQLLVAEVGALHLLLVHVALALQLLDEGAVASLALLLLVQLVLQLRQSLRHAFPQLLQLVPAAGQLGDLVPHLLDACRQRLVLAALLGQAFSGAGELLLLETHEGLQVGVDLLDLLRLLELHRLLLLQLPQQLPLLLRQHFQLVGLRSQFLVLVVVLPPRILGRSLLRPSTVELRLYHLQLVLLAALVLLLLLHAPLLRLLPPQQLLVVPPQSLLLQLAALDATADLGQLCAVGVEADLEDLLLLLELLVGDGVLVDGGDLSLGDGVVLLHEHVQLLHFSLEPLDLLLGEFLVLAGQLEVLVGLGDFSLEVGYGVGVVVGELERRLQLGRPRDDVLGKVPATAQQLFLLFMRVAQGAVDALVLDPKAVERLVGTQTGQNLLELGLQLLVSNGLNAELLSLVVHF